MNRMKHFNLVYKIKKEKNWKAVVCKWHNNLCLKKIKFFKLLPSCKSVNPLQRSYLNHLQKMVSLSLLTRFGTRFPYGILGYTRVDRYEYLALTVPGYELDSNVEQVCTNKARIYSVKQCLSRFEHDLLPNFIGLFNSSNCVLVRSCTIKHDFYSIYLTFTWFTYSPADFCWSYAQIYTFFELLTNKHQYYSSKNNGRCNRWQKGIRNHEKTDRHWDRVYQF